MKALARSFGYTPNSLRSNNPLDDDQIRRVAPSIFAVAPHQSRSERYTYIPTIDVLNGLRKEGFEPFSVVQGRTRVPGKGDFTKHMLRLRRRDQISAKRANEIILLNSHDGTSSYQMLAGVFEFVCQNGMVAGDILDDIRIGHRGTVMDNVIEGAYTVLSGFQEVNEHCAAMQAQRLSVEERHIFAEAALELRFPSDEEGHSKAPIQSTQLLLPRRMEDQGDSLWTTFNVVQENAIRGGLHGRTSNHRRTSTRAVTGIDQDVKLNRALWILAERMSALKSTA